MSLFDWSRGNSVLARLEQLAFFFQNVDTGCSRCALQIGSGSPTAVFQFCLKNEQGTENYTSIWTNSAEAMCKTTQNCAICLSDTDKLSSPLEAHAMRKA